METQKPKLCDICPSISTHDLAYLLIENGTEEMESENYYLTLRTLLLELKDHTEP